MMKVITWSTPRGKQIDLCKNCSENDDVKVIDATTGDEYCQVSQGLHSGGTCYHCDNGVLEWHMLE